MKKAIGFLLVLVMLFSIAACAPKAPASQDAPGSNAADKPDTQEAGGTKEVELTLWLAGTEEDNHYMYLPAAFKVFEERNPGIKINYIAAGGVEEYAKKITMMADSDTLPDIFNNNDSPLEGFGERGVLTEIGPYIEQDPEWSSWKYVEGAYDTQLKAQNGKIYGVPSMCGAAGFFYNKTMFDKAGLEIPVTWEEFKAVVKTFKDAGQTPIAHGAADTWSLWGYFPFFDKYGIAEKADALKNGQTTFVESMQEPLKRVQELQQMGAYPEGVAAIPYSQALQGFIDGQYPIISTGGWELANFSKMTDEVVFNWGPLFSDSEYQQKVGLKGTDWTLYAGSSVSKDPAKLEAALKFLKFMCSPEASEIVLNAGFCFPVYKVGSMDNVKVDKLTQSVYEAITDDYSAVTYSYDLVSPKLMDTFRSTISSVISGTITPEEAAQQMDDFYSLSK